MLWEILAAAAVASGQPADESSNKDLVPPPFEECVRAVRAGSATAAVICNTKPYETIALWGPEPSYRAACVNAMKRGVKWVEARKSLPPVMAAGHGKLFEEQYAACVNPPSQEPPVPERKMIQLWD